MLLMAAFMLLPTGIFAQGGEGINVRAVDRPLKEVISQLEKDYGYRFIFRDDALDMEKRVTVSLENASIDAVLDSILGPGTEYNVRNRQITVWKKTEKDGKVQGTSYKEPGKPVVVHGCVKDPEGEPVVGAFVQEKGTRNGVTTDLDGNYSITVSSPDAVILSLPTSTETIPLP